MCKLIFILGGAGAGKTTVAKALARVSRTALFDMDTLLRPAAEMIMAQSGLDPNDRDSTTYKRLCRDLGYRITMDAALENIAIGNDAIVIGPFTKEIENSQWLNNELATIGLTINKVEVKVVVVRLQDERLYHQRIEARGSILDKWKLENWSEFYRSISRRELAWNLPAGSMIDFDNSELLSEEKVAELERTVFGNELEEE